jgi:serine/threonine-protein kinase
VKVADWTGKDAAQARRTLESAGLAVETDSQYSDDVAKGRVISQSPDHGTLFRGDTVSLVVSKGPELVEVPGGLRGMGVRAATERLEALGFEVRTTQTDHYLGLGFVWSSDPGSGKRIPRGSTITLSLV